MEQTTQNNAAEKKILFESRFWKILRWVPFGITGLTLLVLLVLFLSGGLRKITAWYLAQFLPPIFGLITIISLVIYALIRRRWNRRILITGLIGLIALLPAVTLLKPMAFPYNINKVSPATVIRLPSDAKMLVAWGGDSLKTNYHAATPDQRWAYDFVMEPYFSGSPNLSDYGCYGTPVIAPASGTITYAHDGEPDMEPGKVSNNILAPAGNHIILELETGTYLLIAHLKPGSLLVQSGDTVEEGQVIGECGNSGNTSEPHIHIHHQRQNPAEYPINFAEGLPLYFRDHDGAAMPVGGIEVKENQVFATGDVVQHKQP